MNKGKLTTLLSNAALIPSLAALFGVIATTFGLNIDQTTIITILGFIIGIIIAYLDIDNPEGTNKPCETKIEVTNDELSDAIKEASEEINETEEQVDEGLGDDQQ